MRSAVLFVALLLSVPALAEFDAQHPPPDWMVRGYEAAISDPAAAAATVEEHQYPFADLARFVPGNKASDFVDKLLPVLGRQDRDARLGVAGTLGFVTPRDRATVGGRQASVVARRSGRLCA